MNAELSPGKKKEGRFARYPIIFYVHQVLPSKKTKEIASCELNLAEYAGKRNEPYKVHMKVDWIVKPGKTFDALLSQHPAELIFLVDPTNSTVEASPRPASADTPATPGLSSKGQQQQTDTEDKESDPDDGGAATQSEDERNSHNNNNDDGDAPSSSSSHQRKHEKEDGGSYNPFASLSRRVGGGSTNMGGDVSSSQQSSSSMQTQQQQPPPPSPSPSPNFGRLLEDEKSRSQQQSGSMTQSSAAMSADTRKLVLENKKLKEQLDQAEEKRSELNKKYLALQAKVKQLEKVVPKIAMKELRKDGYVRESTNDLDFSSAGGGNVSASDASICDSIVSAVRSVLDDQSQVSFPNVVYWMSWATSLHNVLCVNNNVKSSIFEGGVDTKKIGNSLASAEKGTVRFFILQLEQLVEVCYKLSHRLALAEIKVFVDRKARSYWDVEVESSTTGQDVVDIFERSFLAMVNGGAPRSVLNQWFYQSLYALNCSIFNSFLENSGLCEPAIALQLKFYVSELENWAASHSSVLYHWRSFKSQLQPLVDLTNLLLLDKTNINVPMLKECAPSLSIYQVKYLLDVYNEIVRDNERVPRNVVKEISEAAQMERVPLEKAMLKDDKWYNLHDLAKDFSKK